MAKRRCVGCARSFEPRRHVPHQRYCSRPECQRARRRCWQREKLAADADYRANQAAAQQCWRERHPEYWRHYRRCHPDSTERNRTQQRERNRLRRRVAAAVAAAPGIANMNVCEAEKPFVSGLYRLIPVSRASVAKSDAYVVKMQLMAAT
jgi:hypothetical protein